MPELTIEELTRIMRTCAGEDESVSLDGDIYDVPFSDLGYDSLALMETTARVEREFGLSLPDEIAAAATPRDFLDAVNSHLGAAP
jgi:minimal PKS acyl carrier protein